MQIRHTPLSGGYCGEVPPLPIPNREVKLTCADGTAMQCGRVGSRLLLSRASDFERFLRLFCFLADWFFLTQMVFGHADCFFCHADFADDADFSLMLFLFPTDFTDAHRFLTCSVWDFADGRSFFTFLPFYFFTFKSPFYFFTFLPFYLYQVYKMLLNCGFYIYKIGKITY